MVLGVYELCFAAETPVCAEVKTADKLHEFNFFHVFNEKIVCVINVKSMIIYTFIGRTGF